MPTSWSGKDERQYKHVVESYKGNPRAREIAARTVNAQRTSEGRTKVQKRLREMVAMHGKHGGSGGKMGSKTGGKMGGM